MFAQNTETIKYDNLSDFLRLISKVIQECEKPGTLPTPSDPVIYLRILEPVDHGFAPSQFQEFDNWDSVQKFIKQHGFTHGQVRAYSFYAHIKNPLYVISVLPAKSPQLTDVIVACEECKYNKGITQNYHQIGNKCSQFHTEQPFNAKFPPLYQKVSYGFPLYPRQGNCPKFIWRRPNSEALKWMLRREKRKEICFFCNKSLDDVEEKDKIVHHKIPLAHRGNNNPSNLEFAHRKCHDAYHQKNPVR